MAKFSQNIYKSIKLKATENQIDRIIEIDVGAGGGGGGQNLHPSPAP